MNGTAELVTLHPRPSTAEEWMVRLGAPDVTADERAAFEIWMMEPANRAAFDACREVTAISSLLRSQPAAAPDLFARIRTLKQASAPSQRRSWYLPVTLAAGAAAAMIGLALLMGTPQQGAEVQAATRHGEQRSLALDDGSVVWLNTDSVIAYRPTTDERRVVLERGEAFFNVRHDAARPFVVAVGKSEVRVVGTQFSVRRGSDRVEVIVKEGKVNVVPDAGPLALLSSKVELTPGNRLRLGTSQQPLKVTAVDASRATAWRAGSIEFDRMTLEEVVAEVNRYTDIPLVIEDPALKAQLVSGRVRVGDVETFTFILRERFDIDSTRRGGVIALSSRPS